MDRLCLALQVQGRVVNGSKYDNGSEVLRQHGGLQNRRPRFDSWRICVIAPI